MNALSSLDLGKGPERLEAGVDGTNVASTSSAPSPVAEEASLVDIPDEILNKIFGMLSRKDRSVCEQARIRYLDYARPVLPHHTRRLG